MMNHPMTGVVLFLLALPLVGGTGYYYHMNKNLNQNVKRLKDKKEQVESSRQSSRLSPEEKKKLDKRIARARKEVRKLQKNAVRFKVNVEKDLGVDPETGPTLSRQKQVEKLKKEMEELATNRLQERQNQRQQQRQSSRQSRMVEWISSRMENWDEKEKNATSKFEENVLNGMDLDEDQKKTAKEVFNSYLSRVKEIFDNTLERIRQEQISPRTAFHEGWGKMQKERTDQQQKLNDADFSDEQSQTFWSRSRRIVRRMIF